MGHITISEYQGVEVTISVDELADKLSDEDVKRLVAAKRGERPAALNLAGLFILAVLGIFGIVFTTKPGDVRLREVLDALEGRAVIFDGLGARVGHLLDEMDEWIERAGELSTAVWLYDQEAKS